jgi:thiopurine S-methyltransferase
MKKEFWIEKWQNNQTGFHKEEVHVLLVDYIDKLNLKKGDTVFVPLCGKSFDMLWLNSLGFNVIAVELSELAVEQFFNENHLKMKKTTDEKFTVYRFENITIYQGDFFDLSKSHCEKVNAIYDRAALIALPDGLIEKYVDRMHEIMPDHIYELLITLELQRTASDSLGPPFSVTNDKVNSLFHAYSSIKLLQEQDIIEREKGFQKQGCHYVYERVYLIEN